MSRRTPVGIVLGALGLALGLALGAARPGLADEEYEVQWSATLEAALEHIASQEADDDVTGFFDRYEYTPNKSSDLPVELGVTDAAVDVFGGLIREEQVRLDADKIRALALPLDEVGAAIRNANVTLPAGEIERVYIAMNTAASAVSPMQIT